MKCTWTVVVEPCLCLRLAVDMKLTLVLCVWSSLKHDTTIRYRTVNARYIDNVTPCIQDKRQCEV